MSESTQPVRVVSDDRPLEVVVVSHSPLFYWWPVWAVGFLMAGLSLWESDQVAFVPRGTVAERARQVEGIDGPRDILVAPADRPLPSATDSDELNQPRLRMAASNNPGIVWAMTLCLIVMITHLKLRGLWSVIAITVLGFTTVLLAVLDLWDPILRFVQVVDIHMNAFGYLSISLFLFVIWLVTLLVIDPMVYLVFTRGQLRVRMVIGEGEKVYDTRGMKVERHRDDIFRHWLLGFGTGDLTVSTAGANPRQFEVPNVFAVNRKLALVNTMLQELEVIKGR